MLPYAVEPGQGWLRRQDETEERARAALLAEYRRLVRVELPAAARAGNWVLRRDHCFARVILDAVCGGCWYARLPRRRGRSAESQLDVAQLTRALQTGRSILTGKHGGISASQRAEFALAGKGLTTAPAAERRHGSLQRESGHLPSGLAAFLSHRS